MNNVLIKTRKLVIMNSHFDLLSMLAHRHLLEDLRRFGQDQNQLSLRQYLLVVAVFRLSSSPLE